MAFRAQPHASHSRSRVGGRTPRRTHIFDNLFGAPPVTLATRSCASSVFSSLSCTRGDGLAVRAREGVRRSPGASRAHLRHELRLALAAQLMHLEARCGRQADHAGQALGFRTQQQGARVAALQHGRWRGVARTRRPGCVPSADAATDAAESRLGRASFLSAETLSSLRPVELHGKVASASRRPWARPVPPRSRRPSVAAKPQHHGAAVPVQD